MKVDIGESHVQEIGGSKSGVTLVNYKSNSTFERDSFSQVFVWRHRVTLVKYMKVDIGKGHIQTKHSVLNILKLKK